MLYSHSNDGGDSHRYNEGIIGAKKNYTINAMSPLKNKRNLNV